MDQSTEVNCPYCLSSEGHVRQVTVKDLGIIFTFTCEDCQRSWDGEAHRIVEVAAGPVDQRAQILQAVAAAAPHSGS